MGYCVKWFKIISIMVLFAEKIVELIEKFIPVSKVRDGRYKNNSYVNSSGLEAIKKKHTRWLKYIIVKVLTTMSNANKLET